MWPCFSCFPRRTRLIVLLSGGGVWEQFLLVSNDFLLHFCTIIES
uniref:Uncharacterized protein n=1 Tax=Rhizophora mucronata TaxID=61149 RepID=A0A2P2Q9R0_RHIMU